MNEQSADLSQLHDAKQGLKYVSAKPQPMHSDKEPWGKRALPIVMEPKAPAVCAQNI